MVDKRTSKIIVPFEGDNSKLKKSTDESKSSLSKLNTTFSQYTGISLTAAGALGVVASGFKLMIGEASAAQVLMKQTEAVIKATGSAAGMTADEIVNMAESERILTGIDDDVIQSGQNMLLTFKNIGEETFPTATRAMEDMAVAMNSGSLENLNLKDTAIQLGKALNDPIAGISALSRVGVTFTEDQKKTIRAMMDVNDIAGAQAVILKELNSEFGGAAEAAGNTLTGTLKKLELAFLGVAETLGSEMIPVLQKAAETLNLLVAGPKEVENALDDHNKEVIKTTENYKDYVSEMVRAYAASGKMSAYQKQLYDAIRLGTISVEDQDRAYLKIAETLDIVSESYYNGSKMVDMDNEAVKRFNQSAGDTNAIDALNEKLNQQAMSAEELATQTMILDGALKGTMGKAYDDYIKKTADLDEQSRILYETIGDLSSREWLSDDQKKALDDAKSKLADIQGQYIANRDTYSQATAQFILDTEMQILSQDGLTQAELDFMAQIGKTLGAYDNATAAVIQGALDMANSIDSGPYAATAKLYDLLAAQHYFEWSVNVREFHTIETQPIDLPPVTPKDDTRKGKEGNAPFANGGIVPASTPIMWQESGSEMAIFPSGGLVLPAAATSKALNGGLYNTIQNIIVTTDNEKTNKLLEDMLDKLESLDSKSFTVSELASNIAYETERQA